MELVCPGPVILLGEAHLRCVLEQYLAHYHAERNQQGPGNERDRNSVLADLDARDAGQTLGSDRLHSKLPGADDRQALHGLGDHEARGRGELGWLDLVAGEVGRSGGLGALPADPGSTRRP